MPSSNASIASWSSCAGQPDEHGRNGASPDLFRIVGGRFILPDIVFPAEKPIRPSTSTITEIRAARWHWALGFCVVAASLGFAALSFWSSSPVWQRGVAVIFVLAALGGVVETSRKKVRLDNEGVYFVRNFRGVRVERSEIGSVTWAAGVGVSLKLLSGAYVPLPEVGAGSQALANTIRAWLKRTCNNGVQ